MHLLDGLNPQQREAVTAGPGPTLILAGPGSGKTRVLTHRIAYLVGQLGVPPHKIMAVTFTNKAAREMRSRVEVLLEGNLRGLTIGTFHSICARFLRREAARLPVTADFVIFDEADQLALAKQAVKDLNLNDKQYPPQKFLNRISAAKNELIGPEEFAASTYFAEITKRVYARYQQLLAANNALDFDDLLMGVARLFDAHPDVLAKYQRFYDHVLVDEFQDTNTAQYAMLKQLVSAHRNMYIVADPDQSIYRWRGADYRNVRRYQEDYPDARTILLEENYRSTQLILDAAMAVIDQHPGRTRKQLFTQRKGGVEIFAYEAYNEEEEAQFVVDSIASLTARRDYAPGDFAIMYRTNAQSRAVEEAFLRAGLPYRLVGAQRFYGRREIKDLIAYLRLIHNPADTVSLLRVINTPPRGVGAKTLEQLQAAASAAHLTPADVLRDLGEHGPKSPFAEQFTGKAGAALANFGRMLNHWHAARSRPEGVSVVQWIDLVLDRTGYKDYLDDGTEEGEERWENIMELRGVAAEYEDATLTDFLQEVALVSDQDTLAEEGKAPTLLTLHAAKGLEFPVVFILGLDEGVLPHQRSFDDPEAMHEERRLMYVGMTRAKDRLYLLRAFRRSLYGDSSLSNPSRFLEDIPDRLLAGNLARKKSTAERMYEKATTWDATPRRRSFHLSSASERAPEPPDRIGGRHKSGQRVRHAQFGEGIVVESKVVSGEEEVIVAFDGVGIKRLAASIANLEIVKG
jgi:DNA helicase-2/ATP-dependent DNA helicase PcrA